MKTLVLICSYQLRSKAIYMVSTPNRAIHSSSMHLLLTPTWLFFEFPSFLQPPIKIWCIVDFKLSVATV